MPVHIRILLSLVVVLLTAGFGFLGSFLGTKIPFWLACLSPLLLALVLLPWKSPLDVILSQENMTQDLQRFIEITETLEVKKDSATSLLQSVKQQKVIPQAELQEIHKQLVELRQLDFEKEKDFREFFFADFRRSNKIILFILFLSGFSGSIFAVCWFRTLG